MGPSLNEWGRALCAAAFRTKTFVSQRDKLARKDLLEQPDVTDPWHLRKGRTRKYAEKIPHGPRIQIWEGNIPSFDRYDNSPPQAFVYEEPRLHSALLSTSPYRVARNTGTDCFRISLGAGSHIFAHWAIATLHGSRF